MNQQFTTGRLAWQNHEQEQGGYDSVTQALRLSTSNGCRGGIAVTVTAGTGREGQPLAVGRQSPGSN